MAYDAEKDLLIENLGLVPGTELTAEIRSYDGGAPKVAFLKHFTKKDKSKASRRAFSLPLDQMGPVGKFLIETDISLKEEAVQASEEMEG